MSHSRSKKMEYDPETGCYRRIVPLDFEQKVEDIVQTEMKKSEVKMKLKSDQPSWRRAEETEKGSTPDSSLEDLTLSKTDDNSIPHYLSGGDVRTEYKFSTKEVTTVQSSPMEKNGDFKEAEIRKAGEAIKAKFNEDRKKFERNSEDVTMSETSERSYELRRRSSDDPDAKKAREDTKERSMSLEKKIKDMEERRARMLRRSSGELGDDTVRIITTIATDTSSSKLNDDADTKEDSRTRRARIREERNKRRLASEGIETKPTKSAGVTLELRGSGFGTSDSYMRRDDATDITFIEKKPSSDKQEFSSEEKTTTKTTKTISLSGSLLDEPNDWGPTAKLDNTKQPTARNNDEKSSSVVQEEEIKVDESEPVRSQFAGFDVVQNEPEDIVFTVKKTSVTNTVESTDEPRKSLSKEITLEERSLDPKTDLISWDEEVVDGGNEPFFKDTKPEKKAQTFELVDHESDIKPIKKPRQKPIKLEDSKTDTKPVKKPRERLLEGTDYKGSLARAERSQDRQRKEEILIDDTDGYRGSLGRSDINRPGSFNRGRNDAPPVIMHDIESDFHVEEPTVELQREVPVERTTPEQSPVKELVAPVPIPRYQEKSSDEERKKRQLEIEEKQRQIMEKQQRASVKRRVRPETDSREDRPRPQSTDDFEDLKEKRRSLLMMWESFAEGDGPGPENRQEEEPRRTSFGYDKMMKEAVESDPSAVHSTGIAGTMDVDDDNEEQRAPIVDVDDNHKLNDDEMKWERAGQFQPGRLKTKFHDTKYEEPNADNIVFETKTTYKSALNNNVEVTEPKYLVEARYNYQAQDDISYSESNEVESAPKRGLWDDAEDQTTHKDEDEDDQDQRKPLVEVDERNRMTEEEARWERVGHFQPGKINTSIFEGGKRNDENEREGPQKWRKAESSSYEQIKKIQRTDSKKEMLVPKKVELQASDHEDVEEQDEPDHFEIGKIDKSSLIYETISDEERQRREKEERNRREMEEIQRAREEERRRQQKEDREVVSAVNTFEDDEFDAKVKCKNVNKIDLTRFGDFQKTMEPVQDPRPVSKMQTKRNSRERIETKTVETVESAPVTAEEDLFEIKVRERAIGKLNLGSSPFMQRHTSKPSYKDVQNDEDIVLQEATLEESAPYLESKNQRSNSSARTVNKLDKSRFSFSSSDDSRPEQPSKDDFKSPYVGSQKPVSDDRKENREREMREWEKSLQLEREQIANVKKAHDKAFHVPEEEEGGSDIITNDIEYQTRGVKKLDTSLFSKFKQEKTEQAPVRKSSVKKEENTIQSSEVVTVETVREVESVPQELTPEEEYEVKRRSIGKLNKDWVTQMYQQESKETEQRRKETEIQRVKQERYEIDKLRNEETRRQSESEDVIGDEVNSVTDKPQDVKRLDNSAMSPFQKSGKSPTSLNRKKTKDEVRQERKLARKESRSKIKQDEIMHLEEIPPVESSPESFDSADMGVGRLDKGKYLQMMGDDMGDKEKRKKQLEEERVKRELEEMEQQREEELRRQQQDSDEEQSRSISTDKPQSVNKIDISQYSQFQQKETIVEVPRRSSIKKSPEISKENVPEREIVQSTVVKEVESAPYSYEEDDVIIEEKPKTVGKLDFNKITQSFSNEAEEKRRRLRELDEERIRREKEEKELLLREQQRHEEDDHVITETSVEEVHSEPKYFEDKVVEGPKKTVGKLDIRRIRQSFSEEAEVHQRRLDEREKERRRREEEEEQALLQEKQQQMRKANSVDKVQDEVITETAMQEVHSIPDDLTEDQMYEEKRKNVGKLDFERITTSFGAEAEKKKRRLESERIQREKEEKEVLDREQTPQREKKESTQEYIVEDRKTFAEQDIDVPSPPRKMNEDEMYEEKRKSVGKLDFNRITKSFGQEAEEKRQRMKALEVERIRRDKEEKELLLREQQFNVDEDIQSKNLQNGGFREEKSTGKLDIDNIIHSFREEDEMGRKRAIELEHERRRRDEEEKLRSRQLERERAHKATTTVRQSVAQEVESSPTEDIFFEEKTPSSQKDVKRKSSKSELERNSSKSDYETKDIEVRQSNNAAQPETTHYVNEEERVISQSKKSVGKLDLKKFSQSIDQDARERERRSRELDVERLRLEREEMEGKTVNQPTPSERNDGRYEGHYEEDKENSGFSRPTPKKLDLSKFSAFGGGLRVTKDDTAVKRREKTQGRQTRPKSIAGTSFKGVANSNSYKEYAIN